MARLKIKTRNKRYQKTEEAILEALMNSQSLPTAGALIKKAHISRSTLYRHHKTVPGIIPDYEREILTRYRNVVRRLVRHKNTQVRTICLRTLVFIMAEQRTFRMLLKYSGGMVIERMILQLRGKLKSAYYLPTNPDKILRVYAKEIVGVIEEWSELGFKEKDIERTLRKIMYLTESMRQRLGPLNI